MRGAGIRVSELTPENAPYQLNMLGEHIKRERSEKLERCIQQLRGRFGYWAVARGSVLTDKSLSRAELSDCSLPQAGL